VGGAAVTADEWMWYGLILVRVYAVFHDCSAVFVCSLYVICPYCQRCFYIIICLVYRKFHDNIYVNYICKQRGSTGIYFSEYVDLNIDFELSAVIRSFQQGF